MAKKQAPAKVTAQSLWSKYAPEGLADLLTLPDEVVVSTADFYAGPVDRTWHMPADMKLTPGLSWDQSGHSTPIEDMLAVVHSVYPLVQPPSDADFIYRSQFADFYTKDQKRKMKGKGGGQFEETGAEGKHKSEAAAKKAQQDAEQAAKIAQDQQQHQIVTVQAQVAHTQAVNKQATADVQKKVSSANVATAPSGSAVTVLNGPAAHVTVTPWPDVNNAPANITPPVGHGAEPTSSAIQVPTHDEFMMMSDKERVALLLQWKAPVYAVNSLEANEKSYAVLVKLMHEANIAAITPKPADSSAVAAQQNAIDTIDDLIATHGPGAANTMQQLMKAKFALHKKLAELQGSKTPNVDAQVEVVGAQIDLATKNYNNAMSQSKKDAASDVASILSDQLNALEKLQAAGTDMTFEDVGQQSSVLSTVLPTVFDQQQYPGTTKKGTPVADYGVAKDKAKDAMQVAFQAYNNVAQDHDPGTTDADAKKLYGVYEIATLEYYRLYADWKAAADPDPKFQYNTLVSELKTLYKGEQTPDSDIDVKTHLADMERYERIHGLKRPKLPATYTNPHGYKKGEQQALDLGVTPDTAGTYTKLGITDAKGNVLDPGRFDPTGEAFRSFDGNEYAIEEQYQDWGKKMTSAQKEAVDEYMGSGSESLNYGLRNGDDYGGSDNLQFDQDAALQDFDIEEAVNNFNYEDAANAATEYENDNPVPDEPDYVDNAAYQEALEQWQVDKDEYVQQREDEYVQAAKESYLQDYQDSSSDPSDMVRLLDGIFEHEGATAPESLVVWRGGRMTESDMYPETHNDNSDIQKGEVVTDPGYISTSLKRSTGEGFQSGDEHLFKIEIPQGQPAAYIGIRGSGEAEMLLPRNSLFLHMGDEVGANGNTVTRLRYLGLNYDPNAPTIGTYKADEQLPPGWYTEWDNEKGQWAGPTQYVNEQAMGQGNYIYSGQSLKEWLAQKKLAAEQEAKAHGKKKPVAVHPGTGELLKKGQPIHFSASVALTLGGKALSNPVNRTSGDSRYTWAGGLRKTGMVISPTSLQDALTATGSLETYLSAGTLPFYTGKAAEAIVEARFYKPDQSRGQDGRWVETGAEARDKAQRKQNALLDPDLLFTKIEAGDADRVESAYREQAPGGIPPRQEAAMIAYQNGGHTFLNNWLRKGQLRMERPTSEHLRMEYDTSGLAEQAMEKAKRLYTGDMLTEVVEEERQAYVTRAQGDYDYQMEIWPNGVPDAAEQLDSLLDSPSAVAPYNIKVYRGIYGDFLQAPKIGDVYEDPGFVSTSVYPERAANFGNRMNVIEVPEGMPAIYLNAFNQGNLAREAELLLPRNIQLVYMGEESYVTVNYAGERKKDVARRWRYIGVNSMARKIVNFYMGDDGPVDSTHEDAEDGSKFTWEERDLRPTGTNYPIPPLRMPQDEPRSTESPNNGGSSTSGQVGPSNGAEGFSVARYHYGKGTYARFYKVEQRRGFHGRWVDEGAKAREQALRAQAQVDALAKKAADEAFTGENVMYKRTGQAAGSNTGGFYTGKDNVERYIKAYDDPTQAYSEVLANEIYRGLGLAVPHARTFDRGGVLHYASDIVAGSDLGDQVGHVGLTAARADAILDGFVADVLTANRDILGMGFDNVLDVNGKIYRIDNGSAFLHRAMGARKPSTGLLDTIGEWESLAPGGRNSNYMQVFETAGYSSPEDMGDKLEKQLKRLRKFYESLGADGWAGYVDATVPDLDPDDMADIVAMLENRTRLLLQKSTQARFYRKDQRRGFHGKWVDEGRLRAAAPSIAASPMLKSTISATLERKKAERALRMAAPEPPTPSVSIPRVPTSPSPVNRTDPTPVSGHTVRDDIDTIIATHTMLPTGTEDSLGMRDLHVWRKALTELELVGTADALMHADEIKDALSGSKPGAARRERMIQGDEWDFEEESNHIRDAFMALPETERRRLTAGVRSLAEDAMYPYINPATSAQLDQRRMGEHNQDIITFATRHHMSVPEYVDAATANLRKVLGNSTVSKRTHINTLRTILEEGRVKTQYETGTSSGSFYPEARAAAEWDMFNYPSKYTFREGGYQMSEKDAALPEPHEDPNVSKRPVYAYLSTRVDKYRQSGGYEGVDSYGDVDLVLKDSVRARTTVVGTDSLGLTDGSGKLATYASLFPAPLDNPNLRMLDWSNNDPLELSFIEGVGGSPYTEAQIHGGVTLADIEYVVLPGTPDPELRDLLEKKGMPWITADDGDSIPTLPDGMTYKEYTRKKLQGEFSMGTDMVSITADFYRNDQRRDKGKFADEGRGRQKASGTNTGQHISGPVDSTDVAPDLSQHKRISVNLGITPYRGKPIEDVEGTQGYYESNRYKGWLADVGSEAQRLHVQVEDIVKVTGIWAGTVEPSASVWVRGEAQAIKDFAGSLGGEYNQEGVMVFSGDEDDGEGALYTMPGVKDRKKALEAMKQAGVEGARLVESRDSTFTLEVADFDGTMHDKVVALSKAMGTETYWTPGKATLLFGGKDYQRRNRQHRGAGTHMGVA